MVDDGVVLVEKFVEHSATARGGSTPGGGGLAGARVRGGGRSCAFAGAHYAHVCGALRNSGRNRGP